MPEDQIENNNNNKLGELLTKAREKLSLSQKEIASRLNLKEEFVAALDANDFSKLPAPTYIKGYIRSYACAVSLNADNLINIYEASAEAPPEILPDVKPVVQASSRDKPVKAMTYLVIFTLGILVIAWWQSQHIVRTEFFTNNTKTTPDDYDIVIHPESLAEPLDVREVYEPSNLNLLELDDHLSTNDSLSTNVQINSNDPVNLDTLKMELTAESWIEIYDATNEQLYRNLAKPGEKISITGTAPLSVTLGNSRAVLVNFNGKVFDTKEYTKTNIAKFFLE